jgi:deoxyribose-phosphate aldolase
MSNIRIQNHLDSTYLKTSEQSGLSPEDTEKKVRELVQECINEDFVLAMIRPEYVAMAREMVDALQEKVQIGTVIGFHEGTASVEDKLAEAKKAIEDGADELDYVINYTAYQAGQIDKVKKEILKGTQLGLEHHKIVKWIIEIAALTDAQIASLTKLITEIVTQNFEAAQFSKVFVKSSTGFYKTEDGKPNGATFEGMQIIKDNAGPLSIKAAGGVRNYEEAVKMIEMGVSRIGTSSAKVIADGATVSGGY